MPMSFPDADSLQNAAKVWKFRQPAENETEEEFRLALHLHVKPEDIIESFEILFKVGWDEWTDSQKRKSLRAQGINIPLGGFR